MGKKKGLPRVSYSASRLSRAVRTRLPGLKVGEYAITSCSDPIYNCIAWAADDMFNWWEPHAEAYWPKNARREYTIAAYIEAFRTLGYSECSSVAYEAGYEKVAIFAKNGKPSHAARQLGPSKWSSKLGKSADISHKLTAVEGDEYGRRVAVLKRPRAANG